MSRQDKLNEIEQKLRQGVTEYFTSEKYAELLTVMSKFHNYSFSNSILIAMQCPKATYVAGFNAWKNYFNRVVKKGDTNVNT